MELVDSYNSGHIQKKIRVVYSFGSAITYFEINRLGAVDLVRGKALLVESTKKRAQSKNNNFGFINYDTREIGDLYSESIFIVY